MERPQQKQTGPKAEENKQMPKPIISLTLLAILNLLLFNSNALATSKIQFEGGAENFVFYADESWTDTDLFDGLKNIMPGDKRTENITVKNMASEYDYVKIYLRAEPIEEGTHDFLAQLTLNVYKNDELISSSPASEQGALETNVNLGTFNYGDEVILTTEISAPTNLKNEHSYTSGEIKWIFTAEAYKDGEIITPNTGTLTFFDKNGATIEIITISTLAIILTVTSIRYLIKQRKA